MQTVTISKKEYQELVEKKLQLDYVSSVLGGGLFSSPPNKDKRKILSAMRKTNKYKKDFLKGIERGLGRSNYFK